MAKKNTKKAKQAYDPKDDLIVYQVLIALIVGCVAFMGVRICNNNYGRHMIGFYFNSLPVFITALAVAVVAAVVAIAMSVVAVVTVTTVTMVVATVAAWSRFSFFVAFRFWQQDSS